MTEVENKITASLVNLGGYCAMLKNMTFKKGNYQMWLKLKRLHDDEKQKLINLINTEYSI